MEPVASLPPLRAALTPLLVADRAVMERASKAYVSYLRAYREHQVRGHSCAGAGLSQAARTTVPTAPAQCGFIFKMADLDLGQLAEAMALLRLPKLKELGRRARSRRPGTDPPRDPLCSHARRPVFRKRKKTAGSNADGWVEFTPAAGTGPSRADFCGAQLRSWLMPTHPARPQAST